MLARLERLREQIRTAALDAFFVTDNLNVRYLTGFTGSFAVLFLTDNSAFLLTDSRYGEQAHLECPDFPIEIVERSWVPGAGRLADKLGLRRIGFEEHALTYRVWKELGAAVTAGELIGVNDPVGRLRMVKDEAEVQAIRQAARIADLAYEHIIKVIKPGMSEREAALELDCCMRKSGAEVGAFETIVASGSRSALPHAKPTSQPICEGELVLLDFGARWEGYHSDITRTVFIGTPERKHEEIHRLVLGAQARAIEAIRPGVPGRDVDAAAREFIAAGGYGDRFAHGLGHSLGLAVHDGRILAPDSEIILQPGMVVTVEPGIYIPGWGGIRIEDDVLVTDSAAEALTRSPRSLEIG